MSRNSSKWRLSALVAPVLLMFVLSGVAFGAGRPADLTAFSALPQQDKVLIEWTMSREFETAFYRCLRSRASDDYGEVIYTVAAGGSVGSARYSYVDQPTAPGEYYYWIEEVNVIGVSEFYGPVRAFIGRTWVYAPLMSRN